MLQTWNISERQSNLFSLHKHTKKLVFSVFFPDVKGALTPTVTAAFVDAAPTL